jgi:hypothetical protein
MKMIRAGRRVAPGYKQTYELKYQLDNNLKRDKSFTESRGTTLSQMPLVDLQKDLEFTFPSALSKNDQNSKTVTKNKLQLVDRGYEELMDQHALQIFMIRNGMVIEETPEYQSFKRITARHAAEIAPWLALIQQYVSKMQIKLIRVNGSELMKLISQGIRPNIPSALSCLMSADDDTLVGQNYLSQLRKEAAIKIQSQFRMRQAKIKARRMRISRRMLVKIQRWMKSILTRKRFKRNKADRDNKCFEKFEERQQVFKENWPEIKTLSRVEVHYGGFGGEELWRLSIEKLGQRTDNQIGRIFRAMQEKVEIIYITNIEIPEEVKRYYYKVMELAGLKLGQKRVHFLPIIGADTFPAHFSTAAKILYSPKTLRSIKRILNNRPGYIIPSCPTQEDVLLSNALNLPLFSPNPGLAALYSKHGAVSTLFTSCSLPIPPSSSLIFKPVDVVPQLSKLIFDYPHIDRWVMKIDGEFGGRGIAYVDRVQLLGKNWGKKQATKTDRNVNPVSINNDYAELTPQQLREKEQAEFYGEVHREVNKHLIKKMVLIKPMVYKDAFQFIELMCKKGGIIEAAPSTLMKDVQSPGVLFQLDPDGEVEIQTTYEKIICNPFTPCGYRFPQRSLPSLNVSFLFTSGSSNS